MYVWTDGTDYLAHHGTKGMKWGVRNYQNPDGTLTALGRARLGLKGTYDGAKHAIKNAKAAIKQARIKSKRAKALKKARAAKAAKAAEAERKKAENEAIEKAVASGDPSEIRKYADKMTTQQIRDANARISAMNELARNEQAASVTASDIAFKKLSEITSKMKTGIEFYNNFAAVSNTFFGTELKKIQTGDSKKKKKKDSDDGDEESSKKGSGKENKEDNSKKESREDTKEESKKSAESSSASKDDEPILQAKAVKGQKWEKRTPGKEDKNTKGSKDSGNSGGFVYAKYEEVKDEYGSAAGNEDAGWVTTQYGPLPLGLITSNSSAGQKYLTESSHWH